MRRSALATILLVPLLLGACARGSTGSDERSSGISGTVTIGPTCPVERPGSACPPVPFDATVRVLSGGEVVATGRSGSDGEFRIDVPPGTYTVDAQPSTSGGIAHASPVDGVVVRAGAFTRVDLSFDSGIR